MAGASGERRRLREERSRDAVTAAVALARCTELRALQVALCLLALSDVFGDLDGWNEGLRSVAGMLAAGR